MKKEIYITQENHSKKLASWAEILQEIKVHKPFTLNPHQVALLILDLQQYFFESESHAFIPTSQFILPQIQTQKMRLAQIAGSLRQNTKETK